MTFYRIEDLDRFFREIDTCDGGIFLQNEDGQPVDLRRNAFVQSLLRSSGARCGLDKLDVSIENPTDTVKLLKYLMESQHESVICA